MRKLWIFLCLCVAAMGTPLTGVVRGAGIPLPGATVTAAQGATTVTVTTADDGTFTFADLAAGAWTVRAEMTGFSPAEQQVTMPPTGPGLVLDLTIAPYQGPAVVATLPPATSPQTGQPEVKKRPAQNAAAQSAPAPNPPEPATPSITAADNAFAVNGSVDNGAASPFGISPAFGNNRPGGRSMYNGGVGLIWGSSALDARTFSQTGQNTPKPSYNNLTGLLQFGGPLVIPHLLNLNQAPQVFVAYEKSATLNAVNTPALVPTVAERGGDLSALGAPSVAPGSISAQATALLNLYPMPNLASGGPFNYQAAVITHQHQDRLQTRVNKFTGRNSFAASLSLSSTRSDNGSLFGFVDGGSQLGMNLNLQWRRTITNRFYTTFATTFTRLATQLTPYFANREDVAGMAGIAGGDSAPAYWGPPGLNFSDGFAPLSDGLPSHNRNQTMGFSGTAFWNYIDHNITFGGDYNRLEFNYLQQTNPRGSFTFNGDATGNAFADFLEGQADAVSLAFGNADKYFRQSTNDLYFTDDWRTTDSLSLDLGARWEYSEPISELYGRLVNLDITPGFGAAAPVEGYAPTGSLTGTRYPLRSLLFPDKHGLEPRLGLAWRPLAASSLLIRAGYGLYRDTSVYQSIALQMDQQPPLSTTLSLAATPSAPLTLATALTTPPGATPNTFAIDPNYRIGYAQTWNASMQRDLPDGMVMTLTYLGTKGTRGEQLFYPNTYAPGAANPCPACPSGFLYAASNGDSTYESGKAQLQRRFHNGLAATVVYTYAHAIDDSALGGAQSSGSVVAQNWLDLDAERARSSFDQRHNLSVTAQYSTGSGIRGGALMRGWSGALFKGWTVTSQLTAGSGLPLTPTTSLIVPGTAFGGIRPDLTGAPIKQTPAGLFINPAAFAEPAAGTFGTAGRDSIEGPSVFSLNGAMQRSFPMGPRLTANLQVQATNVLNHVNYPSYTTLLGSPQFGLPTIANPMRSLQTTLRINF